MIPLRLRSGIIIDMDKCSRCLGASGPCNVLSPCAEWDAVGSETTPRCPGVLEVPESVAEEYRLIREQNMLLNTRNKPDDGRRIRPVDKGALVLSAAGSIAILIAALTDGALIIIGPLGIAAIVIAAIVYCSAGDDQ